MGPEPDEVVVKVAATGICHTDVAWASGELTLDGFPAVMGHETAGVVEETGRAVTRVRPGDAVVLSLAHHCGHCYYCETGRPMLCARRIEAPERMRWRGSQLTQGFGTGGFATMTVVREDSVVPVPPGVPLEVAALAGCAVATGFGAVANIAGVEPGSTVAVLGAGGIGICVVMAAKIAGAEQIAVVDPNPERRAAAIRAGATDAGAPGEPGTLPEGYDFTFECSGRIEAMQSALSLARRGGAVTLIGVPEQGAAFSIPAFDFVVSQRRLLGCLTGNIRPNVDFDRYFRLYRRGLLDLQSLVSGSLPLARIAEGFERNARGEGIRTLITM